MRKLYEKKELLFAVRWIVLYCVILGTIRGNFGDESICMLLALVDWIYIGATIVAAIIYCTYLGKMKSENLEDVRCVQRQL